MSQYRRAAVLPQINQAFAVFGVQAKVAGA
jgi:hypothetical protein